MCFPKQDLHFKYLMEMCRGEDFLLYSSDWPHATFDPLNWVFNPHVSEEGRRKILGCHRFHGHAHEHAPGLRGVEHRHERRVAKRHPRFQGARLEAAAIGAANVIDVGALLS